MFERPADDICIEYGCETSREGGIFAIDVRRVQAWVAMICDDLVHLYGRWADMSPDVRMAFDR